jgi:hypothetical protein
MTPGVFLFLQKDLVRGQQTAIKGGFEGDD